MSADYKIHAVTGQREFGDENDPMREYTVDAHDGEKLEQGLAIYRGASLNPPQPNDVLKGYEIEEKQTRFGLIRKLKKQQNFQGGGARGGGGGGGDPKVQSAIRRQAAQKVAGSILGTVENQGADAQLRAYLDRFRKLTDWLVADVERASNRGQAEAPPPAQPAQPAAPPAPSDVPADFDTPWPDEAEGITDDDDIPF